MMRACSLLFAAGLAGLSAAQSTSVVNLLMPLADPQSLAGSVVSAGPTATTYFVTCPTGADSTDCGLGDGVSLVNGPSTASYAMSSGPNTIMAQCKLDHETADCTGTIAVDGTITSTTERLTGYTSLLLPVTLTAGLEKLSAATTGGASPTVTSTNPGSSSAVTGTSPSSSSSAAVTGTNPSSSSSTAGVPRITQNAVVMGAAALIGGAMLV
ncbi:hypothetical protein VTK56DRAFT_7554 [Thermocarpiscus australiensis]